jgi:hypothetical protein
MRFNYIPYRNRRQQFGVVAYRYGIRNVIDVDCEDSFKFAKIHPELSGSSWGVHPLRHEDGGQDPGAFWHSGEFEASRLLNSVYFS